MFSKTPLFRSAITVTLKASQKRQDWPTFIVKTVKMDELISTQLALCAVIYKQQVGRRQNNTQSTF
jgi:hypothetical protein